MKRLLEFWSASSLILVCFAFIGSSFTSTRVNATAKLAISASTGLSAAILSVTYWASTSRSNQFIGFVVLSLALVAIVTRNAARETAVFFWRRGTLLGLVGSAVAQISYFPVLFGNRLFMSFLPFTNSNNDMASFVAGADNLNHSGFAEYGRTQFFAISQGTKTEFTGSSALISFLSRITPLQVWRLAIPAMCVVIAVTFFVSVEIASVLGVKSRLVQYLVAAWAIFAPMSTTVQGNYFLSQALARLFLMALVLVVLLFITGDWNGRLSLIATVAMLMAGLLVSYSAGAGLCFLVLVQWAVVLTVAIGPSRRLARQLWTISGGIVISLLLVVFRLSSIRENFRMFSTPNITGWPSRTLVPNVLIGSGRTFSSLLGIEVSWLMSTILLALVTHSVFRVRKSSDSTKASLAMAGCLVLIIGSMMFRFGSTTYQTWKAIGTLQPLFIVLLAGSVYESTRWWNQGIRYGSIVALATVAFTSSYSSQDTFRDVTVIPSRGLVQAANDPVLQKIPSLTVTFRPYFETMISPVILNIRNAQFGSDTYLGHPNPDNRCVLGLTSNEVSKRKVLRRYGNVHLTGDVNCLRN